MMWVGRGYFIWCSCWWRTESTKPSFYSDSKNLMAQQWWHVLTSNPLSQAFITRASIWIMCVSCLLRPPCLSSSTVPTPLIRSFVNCCLLVYTRLFVCSCVCAALRASGTWQTAALFLGRLPLPSRGPHWRALALSSLSPPPCSDSGSRAKHGSAGLTDCSQCSSTKPAGPVACTRPSTHSTTLHCTTHRWLDHLLEIIVTGVQQVFQGIPPSPGKQRSDSAAGLHVHVCAAN